MKRLRNPTLDLIRSAAALEVFLSHLRPFFLADLEPGQSFGLLTKLIYLGTGFGEQSVLVFFVLSGYFVGGSVIHAKEGPFWGKYLIQRMTRLWIVLIPSLLLTTLWFYVGRHTGGAPYYDGAFNPPLHFTPSPGELHMDFVTFVGNLFFLQTISVSMFGDNGPLWSLANEFWYYLIFPLGFLGIRYFLTNKLARASLFMGAAGLLLVFLPAKLAMGFLPWVFGAGVAAWESAPKWSGRFTIPALILGGFLAAGTHWVPRTSELSDIRPVMLGLAFAMTLPWILQRVQIPQILAKVSIWFSDFSFTLYLTHYSFLAFVWYTFMGSTRAIPSAQAYLVVGLIGAVTLLYCYGVAQLTEARTDGVRRWLTRTLLGNASVSAPQKTRITSEVALVEEK